jgi:hypothetical protein
VYFKYGKNKEGYWNHELFRNQLEDMIDCMEYIYPNHQFVFEVDSSSGHLKYADNCLDALALNKVWGGKQLEIVHT